MTHRFVYYAHDTAHDLIKIGCSIHPHKRMQPGWQLLVWEYGSFAEERERHRQFEGIRAVHPTRSREREWFFPEPVLMAHITDIGQHQRLVLEATGWA